MTGEARTWAVSFAASLLVAVGAVAITAGPAGATKAIYNNIPAQRPLPGNFASIGNQAYSMSQFGGEVEFAKVDRLHLGVSVVMSSWACQLGNWFEETCESGLPKGKQGKRFFRVPVTISIFAVGPENTVGARLWSRTKTFKMPYRPSDSPQCTGGRWYDEETATCEYGKAFVITVNGKTIFPFPAKAIISVSYNTTDHGAHPVGEARCDKTSEGCPYDSLNVALAEPAEHSLSVGSDPTEDVFVNSTYPEMFCDGGLEGAFGPANCPAFWEGDQPMFQVNEF